MRSDQAQSKPPRGNRETVPGGERPLGEAETEAGDRSAPGTGLAARFDDFGRLGCAWRETNVEDTELESVVNDLLERQYSNPVRVVGFNGGRLVAGRDPRRCSRAAPTLRRSGARAARVPARVRGAVR